MKKIKLIHAIFGVAAMLSVASCAKKLDLFPQNDISPEAAYSSAAGYKSILAKIYGTLSMGGNEGPAGRPDLGGGLDEGSQIGFIRPMFNCQELPTDEAIVAWNDQTIQNYHNFAWNGTDPFIKGMYARPVYNVTLINGYIREATAEKLAARGITGADATEIQKTVAEVRFLRAFNYWVMMDLFGTSTFVTENDLPGTTNPKQASRDSLFRYIVRELKAISPDVSNSESLPEAKTAEYGRVDKAAAWALLARVYLNSNVYLGDVSTGADQPFDPAMMTEAIKYSKKVVDAGYKLVTNYPDMFLADNDKQKDEFIYAINCDGLKTQSYGNTSFLINCAAGDDKDLYHSDGWYGYRATKTFSQIFTSGANATSLNPSIDKRALFTTSKYSPFINTDDINLEIKNKDDVANFNKGLHVAKFRNVRSDGGLTSNQNSRTFSDIDFPVFRLPEMYFIYAEAIKRGGTGGDLSLAATWLTNLRKRSVSLPNPEVYTSDITVDYILDERARELYWEGHRRTDLIRYNKFTTGKYVWAMKGGLAAGTSVDPKYNLYPIPSEFLNSNSNLTQNKGYN